MIHKNLNNCLGWFALCFPLILAGAETSEPVTPPAMVQLAEVEQLAAATVPEILAPAEPLPPPALINTSRVVAQRVVVQGGRTITTQLMEGPPPARPAPTVVAVAQTEEAAEPVERKPSLFLSLSNTVYDHTVTRITWGKNQEYGVFVNADLTLFRGVGRVEAESHIYALNLGIGEESFKPEENHYPKDFPGPEFFAAQDIMILPAAGNPPDLQNTPEYKALPTLLTFYSANEHDLRWKQAVLKAENAARQRWRDANPKQPKDTIIQFWPIANPAPVTSK